MKKEIIRSNLRMRMGETKIDYLDQAVWENLDKASLKRSRDERLEDLRIQINSAEGLNMRGGETSAKSYN